MDIRCSAIWILGRLKIKKGGDLLTEIIEAGEKQLCEQASFSLTLLENSKKNVKSLICIMLKGKNMRGRIAAAYALSFIDSKKAAGSFFEIATDDRENVNLRAQVIEGLGYYLQFNKNKRVLNLIRKLLESRNVKIRFWSIFAVGTARDKVSLPILSYIAKNNKSICPGWWSVRKEALGAIHNIKYGEWPDKYMQEGRIK